MIVIAGERGNAARAATLIAVLSLALLTVAPPVGAEAYIVTLENGNVFLSKYKPIPAAHDPSMLLIMTDVGNTIAIDEDSVASIVNDAEHRGFGTVLDTTTVLIGFTANDAPDINDPDTAAALANQAAQPQFAPPPVFTSPLVAEPNQGGGIPVSFATSGLVPTSPAQGAVPPN